MCIGALVAAFLSLPGVSSKGSSFGEDEDSKYPRMSLCAALAAARPGTTFSVELAGVYLTGTETQVLYDPSEPSCEQDVQPVTWVEFTPEAAPGASLEELLARDHRASVILKGELSGPKAPGPDNPALPVNISFANRVGGSRYGSSSRFRTQFVVKSVVQAEPVAELQSWEKVALHDQYLAPSTPDLRTFAPPKYPLRAQRFGIEGDVLLRASFSRGKAQRVDVLNGDRVLSEAAVDNIKTWRLRAVAKATLDVRYVFKLEDRVLGSSREPRVQIDLPRRVEIVAPSLRW